MSLVLKLSPTSLRSFLLGIVLVPSFFAVFAQQQYISVGYKGSIPDPKDISDLQNAFSIGNPQQQTELLERLGIKKEIANGATQERKQTGVQILALDDLDRTDLCLMLLQPSETAIPEPTLYLLVRSSNGKWKIADERMLAGWFATPTVELLYLPKEGTTGILAHHLIAGHGSGYNKEKLELLAVRSNRFVELMEVPEFMHSTIWGTSIELEQKTTLLPFPDGSLEETRATFKHNGTTGKGRKEMEVKLTKVERRRWRWNPNTKKYEPSAFLPVH